MQVATAEVRFQRLVELQSLLSQVAREIGPAVDLEVVLKTVLRAMRSLVEFKGGTICLVDNAMVYIAASDPPVSAEVKELRLPVGSGLAGRAIAEGVAIYSPDLDRDDRVDQAIRNLGSNTTMKSYLAVPLVCLGKVIGLLQVDSVRMDAFDDEDVRLIDGLAVQVAGAIESARRIEEARALEQMKKDFISRVSHELRTPLTILRGFTSTLRSHEHELSASDRRMMVDRIDQASGRLNALIEQVLTVSTLEAGMGHLQIQRVNIREMIARVCEASGDRNKVAIDCEPDLEEMVDRRLVGHVVHILVDNALSFAGSVEIKASRPDGELIVEVADRGPGVPEEMSHRVFESFYKGGETRKGMGLGLSLARALATRMDGQLNYLARAGGGALFVLRLPSRMGAEEQALTESINI